jgi:dipeptidyl aminopeptidase/acylaminoacyl peptidase
MTREAGGRRPRGSAASRDPYGIGPVGGYIAPIVAVVGLLVIALVTLNLLQGQLPFLPATANGNGNGNGGGNGTGNEPQGTPAPSNVVVTPPDTAFIGSIVYAKAGNIWVQSGTDAKQLTDDGHDSMPTYSADGSWIYFIRVEVGAAKFPTEGNKERSWYDLFTPVLMRIRADGTQPKRLLTGRYTQGSSTWFYWLRQPTPSPDNKTIAVVSDGPNPLQSDIVLQTFTPATKQLKSLNLPETTHLGHQDPAWRPDGKVLLYVRNSRDGTRGAPQIFRYDVTTKRTRPLTGPGYLAPAWSPDGRWIAATKTDAFDTNIVILDAVGTEVLRVTDDGQSFSPVWSPAGDAVAFLHLTGTSVDLRMAKLDPSSGQWAVAATVDLTKVSGLDGTSRPSWFVPLDQRPATLPSPGGAPPPSASPSVTP